MAGCYHDQKDFQTDMKIEIAKEDEIVKEGHDLDAFNCDKNPRHDGFIPFKDLTLEDLPESQRTMETLNIIKTRGNTVVRILVNKRENGKRIKICGTGYVNKYQDRYYIQTNNHVVKTDEDVKNCTVEFFYDSHDRSKVIESKGVKLFWTSPYGDITLLEIHPVPDSVKQLDMMNGDLIIPFIVLSDQNNPFMTGISSPSYVSSARLHCTNVNINDPNIEIMFLWFRNKSFSYLKSSYFRFQPIPPNIQDITNIALHVDEGDGNSTVIPGKVVKFYDEYVVKISESIFQDKVKKCRLVWNGEVISRGTRLYFEQIKARDIFGELIDNESNENTKLYDNYVWTFDFSPKKQLAKFYDPCKVKKFGDVCCIGHPHGFFKMVTFGMVLGFSIKHFDNNGRQKDQPGDDCRYNKTKCMNYSCKTCPGSSGSPVFPMDGSDCMVGLSHFMGRRKKGFVPQKGQDIENVNTAWIGKNFK